jgi:hypothetical protein
VILYLEHPVPWLCWLILVHRTVVRVLPWPQVAKKWLFGRCDARELADIPSGQEVQARQELEAFNVAQVTVSVDTICIR